MVGGKTLHHAARQRRSRPRVKGAERSGGNMGLVEAQGGGGARRAAIALKPRQLVVCKGQGRRGGGRWALRARRAVSRGAIAGSATYRPLREAGL